MSQKQKFNQEVTQAQAEAGPPLTPEAVVAQLRALQLQIPEIAPLTKQERKLLQASPRVSDDVVHASITMIGVSDGVQHALGQGAEDVRQFIDDTVGWGAVEDELKAMLRGQADANLVRRQRARLTVGQAFGIVKQLARSPENAALRPHLAEVNRLRGLARRRKASAKTSEPPAPSPKPGDSAPDGANTASGGDPDRK
jgi:hypothetical protein